MLLEAGVPLDESLRLCAAQASRRRVAELTGRLLTCVLSGEALSAGIARVAPDAPPVLSSLVQAGEARGTLASALTEAARHFDRQLEIRSKLRAALLYPSVLCATAIAAGVIIGVVLVPALMPIFLDAGAQPPFVLRAIGASNQFVAEHWIAVSVALVGLAWLAAVAWRRPATQEIVGATCLAIPGLSSLVHATNVAALGTSLGLLLKSGVPPVAALQITSQAVPNASYARALREAAARTREGMGLADAIGRSRVVPAATVRLIAIGLEASRLDDLLIKLGEMSASEAQLAIDRLMGLLAPTLTILVGGAIGMLVISVMQAVLSIHEVVLR